jgi:hypothetical protein
MIQGPPIWLSADGGKEGRWGYEKNNPLSPTTTEPFTTTYTVHFHPHPSRRASHPVPSSEFAQLSPSCLYNFFFGSLLKSYTSTHVKVVQRLQKVTWTPSRLPGKFPLVHYYHYNASRSFTSSSSQDSFASRSFSFIAPQKIIRIQILYISLEPEQRVCVFFLFILNGVKWKVLSW